MTIRSAALQDAETVCQLIHKLADFEGLSAKCTLTTEETYAMMQKENGLSALLAETERGVIGFAAYYFIPLAMFSGKKILYIEDIWIEPEVRRQGIASQLFQTLEQIATEQNCMRLEWKCLIENQNAVDFYQTVGGAVSDTWLTFMKPI